MSLPTGKSASAPQKPAVDKNRFETDIHSIILRPAPDEAPSDVLHRGKKPKVEGKGKPNSEDEIVTVLIKYFKEGDATPIDSEERPSKVTATHWEVQFEKLVPSDATRGTVRAQLLTSDHPDPAVAVRGFFVVDPVAGAKS
ncbi:MAG TPA: hypothetical protein VM597_19425 [Gemmataceae bacterium]|jgi:hypothetical protein|nr:hypothetical protein [Gemmataceae bacterium]